MKHKKEIIVAILAIIALFVLYFGFNFLKGVNIFNNTTAYVVKSEKMNEMTFRTIASTIDAKDEYTNGHSQRVAEYAVEIARTMGK